ELPLQERLAATSLDRQRIAVGGGPALEQVHDVDVAGARPAERREHRVEELAGRADERLAAQIFLLARRFADEHPVGVFVADAEHGVAAGLAERAGTAAGDGLPKARPVERGMDLLRADRLLT